MQIVRKTRNLEKLMRKIQKLSRNTVESGYFREQGNHSESNIPYATMMNLHEYGFYGMLGYIPSRPVRAITLNGVKGTIRKFDREINQYLFHNKKATALLNSIGNYTTGFAQSIFGVNAILESNSDRTIEMKGANTPLVDNGEFRDAWSYRNSIDNSIKSYSYS